MREGDAAEAGSGGREIGGDVGGEVFERIEGKARAGGLEEGDFSAFLVSGRPVEAIAVEADGARQVGDTEGDERNAGFHALVGFTEPGYRHREQSKVISAGSVKHREIWMAPRFFGESFGDFEVDQREGVGDADDAGGL